MHLGDASCWCDGIFAVGTKPIEGIVYVSEDQKKQLEQQLWNIADTLRGKMDADEFRDYILGFIFYKYLSEKMEDYANDILAEDGLVHFP